MPINSSKCKYIENIKRIKKYTYIKIFRSDRRMMKNNDMCRKICGKRHVSLVCSLAGREKESATAGICRVTKVSSFRKYSARQGGERQPKPGIMYDYRAQRRIWATLDPQSRRTLS